jgi:hypothetical protein
MRYWGIFTHKDKLVIEDNFDSNHAYPSVWCKKEVAQDYCNSEKQSVHEVEIIKKHKKGGNK